MHAGSANRINSLNNMNRVRQMTLASAEPVLHHSSSRGPKNKKTHLPKLKKAESKEVGEGHQFFKHNKMVNLKRKVTNQIYGNDRDV